MWTIYCVYMLANSNVGCYIGTRALGYADDIVILAPTASAMVWYAIVEFNVPSLITV